MVRAVGHSGYFTSRRHEIPRGGCQRPEETNEYGSSNDIWHPTQTTNDNPCDPWSSTRSGDGSNLLPTFWAFSDHIGEYPSLETLATVTGTTKIYPGKP